MRKIKFRFWDGFKMFYHGERAYHVLFNGEVWDNWNEPTRVDFPTGKTSLMQYIGLKDVNGKDIYEGDVIRKPIYGTVIVIWNEGICAFQYAYHAHGKGTAIGGRVTNNFYQHESSSYEIIGNIYENPELLEPKKI